MEFPPTEQGFSDFFRPTADFHALRKVFWDATAEGVEGHSWRTEPAKIQKPLLVRIEAFLLVLVHLKMQDTANTLIIV